MLKVIELQLYRCISNVLNPKSLFMQVNNYTHPQELVLVSVGVITGEREFL